MRTSGRRKSQITINREGFDKVNPFIASGLVAIAFTGTIFAFRLFAGLQANVEELGEPFLQILGVHTHHWQVALFLIPTVLVLIIILRIKNVPRHIEIYIDIFLMAILIATFFDGFVIGYP
jgi:hypothetical protein